MDGVMLDAELATVLEAMPPFSFTADALAMMRQAAPPAEPTGTETVACADHIVRDDPRVVVRVHRPRAAAGALPCIFSIHGGGYIVGSYDMDDARLAGWAEHLGCVAVSVEYRLAPETPYPGPLDDCLAALSWVFDHATELGVDRDRVGIAGLSAGGGLAAALALLVRDQHDLPIAFQLLECPMIDDRQVTPSSCIDELPIWSRESNELGWRSYLGDLYGADELPAYAAATRAADLTRLPPALVIVGGADGFRDEDIDYACRLGQAGVPTELHVLPGAPHGVLPLFAESAIGKRWVHLVDDWLARHLSP